MTVFENPEVLQGTHWELHPVQANNGQEIRLDNLEDPEELAEEITDLQYRSHDVWILYEDTLLARIGCGLHGNVSIHVQVRNLRKLVRGLDLAIALDSLKNSVDLYNRFADRWRTSANTLSELEQEIDGDLTFFKGAVRA